MKIMLVPMLAACTDMSSITSVKNMEVENIKSPNIKS